MVRWLAPILSFTAEEAWGFLPGKRNESVLLNLASVSGRRRARARHRLARVHRAQGGRGAELERLRTAGAIGAPLEAEVSVYARGAGARLMALQDELRFVLITSQARWSSAMCRRPMPSHQPEGVWIEVQAVHAAQMRALLASAQRRGQRSAASGTLRALRRQRRRARRGAEIRMSTRKQSNAPLALAAAVGMRRARRPAEQGYIVRHLGEFEFTTVLPILDITLMHNVGAAFSFLASASGWQRWLFIALACGVSAIVLAVPPAGWRPPAARAGLSLVLGGALGNVIDRIRLGCGRFHPLSLESGVFSGVQRRRFGDHGRRCVSAAGCAAGTRGKGT
jgi:hypothetical protein